VTPGARIGSENREAVRSYFANHIGCTNKECSAALGLSVMAVGRHVARLRREWQTPERPAT
jgi:predicted ArsR family transcriptional regulator